MYITSNIITVTFYFCYQFLAEDLEMYVFPPTPRKFDIPPTPPLTPLKRLTSLARDRKSINNKGGDIFVFPEKVE